MTEAATDTTYPSDGLVNKSQTIHDKMKNDTSLGNVDQLFKQQPCARKSILYGIGSGLAVGILQYYRKPVVLKACNYSIGGFVLVSSLAWPLCVRTYTEKKARSKLFIDALRASSVPPAEIPNDPPSSAAVELSSTAQATTGTDSTT